MEKRRIRLEINGVVCGLVTSESDAYMNALADEVALLMMEIQEASPYITREAAALTAALGYCDDMKKAQERADELEVEAELWQEEKEKLLARQAETPAQDPALVERMAALERENTVLAQTVGELEDLRRRAAALEDENAALREQAASRPEPEAPPAEKPPEEEAPRPVKKHRGNPLRYEDRMDQLGLVSFFEQRHEG